MAYTYAPSYQSGSKGAESTQETGLGTATNIMKNRLNAPQTYADDPSKSMQGPANLNVSGNVAYKPMSTVNGLGSGDYSKIENSMQSTQGMTPAQIQAMQNSIQGTAGYNTNDINALRNSMGTVQGLQGGDYQALQNALQNPIYRQGQQAQQNIADTYGGRGLYGSVGGGLMSGAQSASQLATQDALSNAVTQRYNLQLQDQQQQIGQNQALSDALQGAYALQNQDRGLTQADQQAKSNAMAQALSLQQTDRGQTINQNQSIADAIQNAYGMRLDNQGQMIDQNKALFSSGAATSDQQNTYNQLKNQIAQQNSQQQIDFLNQKNQAASDYTNNRNNWQNSIDELNFQRALQLAGQGNSGAQIEAQMNMAKDAADAQQQAALYQGIGSVAGGLMGSYDGSGNSGWNFSDLKFW